MHKMHNAEEYLCRYDGPCDRKQPGSGFARSFNRGDHEKRVHQWMVQENVRSKGRPKGLRNRDNNSTSDESSTSTIGATVPTSPKPTNLQNYPAPVNMPLAAPSMDTFTPLASLPGGTNFGSPLSTVLSMMQNQNQVIPGFPDAKRTRFPKADVKSNTRGPGQTSKTRQDYAQQWAEHVHKLRDLASRLPNDPDNSSDGLLCSIEEKARELLGILQPHRILANGESQGHWLSSP